MKSILNFVLLGACMMIFLSSCKVYRNAENLEPAVSKEDQEGPFVQTTLSKLVDGDKIMVLSKSGKEVYMNFSQVEDGIIKGSLSKIDGKNVKKDAPPQSAEVPLAEIERLYVMRVSAGATIPVVIFGAFGLVVGIIAVALAIDPIMY